jgi:hypothetical protein
MTDAILTTIIYEGHARQVAWCGICMVEGEAFNSFMVNDVSSRLHDEKGAKDFEKHLRSLSPTGFAQDTLNKILAADVPEERDWAVGESIAEAYLNHHHNITWPWNHERDKRNPKASLPGADLIGFEINGDDVRLVLGEVKTSSDAKTPPGVMNGRSGMKHQIDNLTNNLGLINKLLKWLLPRCKGTEYEVTFNAAITLYLESGNKAVALFGVLIRDTLPNQLDLKARGELLSGTLQEPTSCRLIAIYLPCAIVDLPDRVGGRRS